MGYEVRCAVVDVYDNSLVHWNTLKVIGIEKIKKWAKDNPMPESDTFRSFDEFIENVERADGAIVFSTWEKPEFMQWVADMLDDLM